MAASIGEHEGAIIVGGGAYTKIMLMSAKGGMSYVARGACALCRAHIALSPASAAAPARGRQRTFAKAIATARHQMARRRVIILQRQSEAYSFLGVRRIVGDIESLHGN